MEFESEHALSANISYVTSIDSDIPSADSISTQGFFAFEEPKYRAAFLPMPTAAPAFSSGEVSRFDEKVNQYQPPLNPAKSVDIPSLVAPPPVALKRATFKSDFQPIGKSLTLNAAIGLPIITETKNHKGVPLKPFYLVPTHFECKIDIEEIVRKTSACLFSFPEINFEYHNQGYDWAAVLVRGSSYCKFEVRVYADEKSGYHIVEANRLTGDSSGFYPIFHELKSVLSDSHSRVLDTRTLDSFATSSPMPGLAESLSDSEAAVALQPILQMAQDSYCDAQLAAAQILCDLTLQDEWQQQLCDNGCIPHLVTLLKSPCESTRRLAVLTVSNLSESQVCQIEIVKSGILPELLSLAVDGPYYNADLRRSGARILANVSDRLATVVASQVEKDDLTRWIGTVENIGDKKLRLQADRACQALKIIVAN